MESGTSSRGAESALRPSTIRARVALASTVFALVLVGTIALGTYVLVARGMHASAVETADRLASAARRAMANSVLVAEAEARAEGLTGRAADEYARSALLEAPPSPFAGGLAYEGSFALHVMTTPDAEPELVWAVGEGLRAREPALRYKAIESGERVSEYPGPRGLLRGMFVKADLGSYTTFVPVEIPGVHAAVLDVSYIPKAQEAILDATRTPMLILGALALVGSLLTTSATTRWVMFLIDDLRRTAESIDVGALDVRLPETGDNEVADLARALNRLIDNLQRRNEVQARFIADASHELATPVAGIRGYVNILRAWGAEDPKLRDEAIGAIDKESRRMARLCSDLLSLIRSEEQIEYRQLRYDINAVCREVLAGAATRHLEKGQEYIGPGEGALWVRGDPDRIEEALGILVDNACKYTPAAGRVSVTTRRSRSRVIVEVSDTGVGIPEEDLQYVFERFYRSDVSRSPETGGFGLGLAIAKHIIDMSGGAVEVRSTLGVGTTFTVSLPRQGGR